MAIRHFALVALVALTLGACEEERYRSSARHYIPIPSATYTLMAEKGMSKDQPILIRSYKKESELEVWKKRGDGKYALLKTFPMCRWSGQLGPKVREGDRMAPEGFYAITPGQMNPNSSYYVSFNMGYPNAYDRSHGRTGAHLMVHGACSSAGCYSMTDDQIGEIYALVREAQSAGQKAVQMQALPFRMTPENLAKHRLDPNIAFWKNLKEGTDYFEVAKDEPAVGVSGGRYVFNGGSTAAQVAEKRRSDEVQVAALVAKGTPAIKLIYDDGDQHSSFKSTLIASGSDSLNRSVSWASRDVGVSRPDALSGGPRVVVLDDKGKAKATARAASADDDAVLAAVASAAAESAPAAKAEPAKPAAAEPAAPKPAAAPASAATQVAKVLPGAGQQAPVAASVAAAPAPAAPQGGEDNRPFYQRALSFVPLIGGSSQPAPTAESAPVASVIPDAPTSVRAPLPPRRADSLRTSRLDQPAAAYSSQSALR
ncbi:murein L,D-transpeptidase family protein [Bosea sp. BK604]|uniref:L,D-transpeptidase family protein n=1 Tax=Bosea sp. BK604 TaxID=2512180 RepID=UPI00104BC08B|nr:murein L,D-transpeptidase family protein [Bosea sp. BK604]TCR66998.1 murein L,D-transpeptidase YafK [Bosea sp. BK604]